MSNEENIIINEEKQSMEQFKSVLIYCPECGKENYPLNRTCINCNSTLISFATEIDSQMNSFEEILTEENIKKITETDIPLDFYEYLLDSIVKRSEDTHLKDDLNVLEKILLICNNYVKIRNNDQIGTFGLYDYNTIVINPTYSKSLQSATLIKNLSIDIHLEILESFFMYIFNVKSNVYIRSFIDYCRYSSAFENFIQKYYSSRVEAHFLPNEYDNYEDVEQLYFSNIFEEKEFKKGLLLGNTYAQEIIKIFEKIFNEEIIEELAEQFKLDNEDKTDAIRRFECDKVMTNEEMILALKNNMVDTIKYLMNTEEARKKLNEIKKVFEELEKIN